MNCSGDIPKERHGHSAVSVGTVMYVFGGQGPNTDDEGNVSRDAAELVSFNDVYRLDSTTMHWSLIETNGNGPTPRHSHSTCLHERSESILLFGGTNPEEGTSNDVWSLSLKNFTWKRVRCTSKKGSLPEGREMHTACINDERNIMYILGGRKEDGTVYQDFWSLDIGSFRLCLLLVLRIHHSRINVILAGFVVL
jgi:N-acetylneuraminic acid mutarotase